MHSMHYCKKCRNIDANIEVFNFPSFWPMHKVCFGYAWGMSRCVCRVWQKMINSQRDVSMSNYLGEWGMPKRYQECRTQMKYVRNHPCSPLRPLIYCSGSETMLEFPTPLYHSLSARVVNKKTRKNNHLLSSRVAPILLIFSINRYYKIGANTESF